QSVDRRRNDPTAPRGAEQASVAAVPPALRTAITGVRLPCCLAESGSARQRSREPGFPEHRDAFMANWFQHIFGQSASSPAPDPPPLAAPDVVALQSELQQLRLEFQERDQQLRQAREELNRQRAGESARVQEGVQAAQEKLLNLVAAPVVQLLTQAHLLEGENKPVQARALLAVSPRLVPAPRPRRRHDGLRSQLSRAAVE